MKHVNRLATLGLLSAALAGCAEEQVAQKKQELVNVVITTPVTDTVSDFEDFTGRFDAIFTVEIRARVTGYLDKVHFADGTEVNEGDLLFEIDPRPYETELNRTEANVHQAESHLRRLDADQRRANNLYSRSAIGREEYDRIIGDYSEAQAAVGVAKAAGDMAKLSLEFTKVKSPISGRLSRRLVDPGNLVQADQTPLTTIVSLDPLYVYFEVDERTLLQLRRLVREGRVRARSEGAVIPILVGLADELDEEGGFLFPHKGEIDFSDNKVDAATGTLQLRGKLENPKSRNGTRVLSPGLFAHVRLPVGDPHKAVLLPMQALARDQGDRVVYVFEKDKDQPAPWKAETPGGAETARPKAAKDELLGKVVKRKVTVREYSKGLMIVETGLNPGEVVVVSGLQRIKDNTKVRARESRPLAQTADPKAQATGE
jgi:RND family efflux transporter MFP subunit